ncbi:hypothetical protein ACFFRR_004062 [Megaselia abdita]
MRNFVKQFLATSKYPNSKLLFTKNVAKYHRSGPRVFDANKVTPNLIYLHNPWQYMKTKLQFYRLYFQWDKNFREKEFIRGSKMAVCLMTDLIRNQNALDLSIYTTSIGLKQIGRDMSLSRNDPRLPLIKFREEDIKRAVPLKATFTTKRMGKHCLVDMIFVAMRNVKDFENPMEAKEYNSHLNKYDNVYRIVHDYNLAPHRIAFAEIFMRLYRDYSLLPLEDWSISFYKVTSFDILNYRPPK